MPQVPLSLTPEGFSKFGELLRYLRERAHLSQRELAALVGYHSSYISYLEKNMRSLDEASLLGRFVPALGLENESSWVARLLELSNLKKDEMPIHPDGQEAPSSAEKSSSLPVSLTSMIGREYESARLRKLILDPTIRLVSILGPPGVGKTCLSLNVARLVFTAFRHGVVFVDLTPVREPHLLHSAIALALGIADSPKTSIEDAVKLSLSEKNLLLILDNFEQIVDVAPQLLQLLGAAPEVKMIVTSREVLRLRGEQEFHLKPLPTPLQNEKISIEQLMDIPSVGLFVARARAVKPEFNLDEKSASLVAEICSRLDGLPLAIELAAARIRTMNPTAMLEQFNRRFDWLSQGARDLPAWRQTLLGAVEWSANQLTDQQRMLFNRLSIFSGGWTLAAAESICSDEDLCPKSEIFSLLIQLMEKSLVIPEDENGRYAFLETLREFSFESLRKSGEYENLRRKHFEYFLEFARTAKIPIRGGNDSLVWLLRMENDYNNLRQALAWAVETPERASLAMDFGSNIHVFWLTRSHIREARYWLMKILALDPAPGAVRANLLRYASDYASSQGDYAEAQSLEEEAMAISKSMGDEAGIYYSLDGMAMLAGIQGDYARAAELLEKVLAYRRRKDDPVLLTATLNNLAIATRRLGNVERAKQLFLEAVQINRKVENLKSLSHALHGLADVYLQQGNFQEALGLHKESILIRIRLGDLKGMSHSLNALAMLVEKMKDETLAATLEGAAAHFREEIGMPIQTANRSENEEFLKRLREKLGTEKFESAWFDGQSMSQQQLIDLVVGVSLGDERNIYK
jgi:predicted ATPase/transcriptional regulator with XRE-family HTH domain